MIILEDRVIFKSIDDAFAQGFRDAYQGIWHRQVLNFIADYERGIIDGCNESTSDRENTNTVQVGSA